jgi:multidrug efflux pump subunit AcrA (membrane-fusion protein)
MEVMRGKWLLIAGAVIMMAIAAGALSVWRQDLAKKAVATAPQPSPGPPPGAEIVLTGKVQAVHIVEVPASIEGIVNVLHVEPGQEVYEGQLLASIKNTRLESARDLAEHELERAQTRLTGFEGAILTARLEASRATADATRSRGEFERVEKLFQRQKVLQGEGATPKLVFEKAQQDFLAIQTEYDGLKRLAAAMDDRVTTLIREIDAARRSLNEKSEEADLTKSDLAATEVHAPVDGIVLAIKGEVGSEIDRNRQDFFQIATNLGDLEVALDPDPDLLKRLQPGEPVLVFLTEANNEALPGTLSAIRGAQAIVDFKSPSLAIKPGLSAQVRLKIK